MARFIWLVLGAVWVLSFATMCVSASEHWQPDTLTYRDCVVMVTAGLAGNSEYVEDPWMPSVRTVKDAQKTCNLIFGKGE